ncbi:hypothetical protein [Deinococcus yavapaiensis]|uniref:Uncharacterized protein n=1 Tax=Deinococcus yavapaiensis KR-236 TaxID=694435 RepID=A0A318S9K4_9DEIO|nr:hypothetical protein [Deinococcus yavapaiensis]PYE53143.1 hypothetical protein DES52_110127 [Deinococcus yavapaiensis KR-236]
MLTNVAEQKRAISELIEVAQFEVAACPHVDEDTRAELLLCLDDVRGELTKSTSVRYALCLKAVVELVLDDLGLDDVETRVSNDSGPIV